MDPLTASIVFLLGAALRLGFPLGITVIVVWLLQRLDARWEIEAEKERTRVPATLTLSVPCWVTRNCPAERRAICPAYLDPTLPCWQLFRDQRGQLREACLGCEVFIQAPVPVTA